VPALDQVEQPAALLGPVDDVLGERSGPRYRNGFNGRAAPGDRRDDLISMKRASGRPIDRSDIVALTEPD
jgi:hypothetical protein